MRRILLALAAFLSLTHATNAAWRDLHTSDGVTIRYRLTGSGEPVIVLAGGPGCSGDYMIPIAEHLAGEGPGRRSGRAGDGGVGRRRV